MSTRKKSQQDAEEYKAMMGYRDTLQRLAEQSQSDYDKAVMALSGGALGVSFGYMKDIAGPPPYLRSYLLNLSWSAWTLSVVACLFSLGISGLALRKAIAELDAEWSEPLQKVTEPPRKTTIWGKFIKWLNWDEVTKWLNWSGGILFAAGAFLMIFFVASNHHDQHPPVSTTTTSTPAAIPTGAGSGSNPTSGNRATGASPTTQPSTPNPPLILPNAIPNPTTKTIQPSPSNTPTTP